MGTVTDAYLAGFEAGYDLAVELARGQAESRRCDSRASQGGQEGADGCNNRCSGLLKRFSSNESGASGEAIE